MGIKGAALAADIGQSLPVVIYIVSATVRPLSVDLSLKNITVDGKTAKRLYAAGIRIPEKISRNGYLKNNER